MGHNSSDRKRRTFIVSAKLADVRNWLLMVECTRCQHHRIIPVAALLYRDDVQVGDLLPRLCCLKCRKCPDRASIARLTEEIVLIGPGTFP